MTITEKEAEMAKKKSFKKPEVKRFPTGSTVLDCILSEGRGTPGGYPIKVMTLNSKSKAGKTRVALEAIYAAMKYYGKDNVEILYLDAESGMSIDTMTCYGFVLEEGGQIKTIETVEEMQVEVSLFCKRKDPKKIGLVLIDSVDALATAATLKNLTTRELQLKKEGKIDAIASYNMDKPKLLSEIMPIMVSQAEAASTFVLPIQQLRDNVGAGLFEKKTRVGGGHALPYYTSVTFELRRVAIFGPKDHEVGYVLEMMGDKTRTKYERRKAYIAVWHHTGFDTVKSDLIYLYALITDKNQYDEMKSRTLKWEETYVADAEADEVVAVTNAQYKEFAASLELKEEVTKYGDKYTITNIKKYIDKTPKVFEEFVAEFGVMSLDALCTYIEENNLEEELKARVQDKFFTLEESLLPKGRKSKRLV